MKDPNHAKARALAEAALATSTLAIAEYAYTAAEQKVQFLRVQRQQVSEALADALEVSKTAYLETVQLQILSRAAADVFEATLGGSPDLVDLSKEYERLKALRM